MKIANCAALALAASCFNGGDAYTVSRSTLRNLAAPKSIVATPSGAAGRTGNMKMEGPYCVLIAMYCLSFFCAATIGGSMRAGCLSGRFLRGAGCGRITVSIRW
jgi:hypothetical protein